MDNEKTRPINATNDRLDNRDRTVIWEKKKDNENMWPENIKTNVRKKT